MIEFVVEVNVVATKTIIAATESEENDKKIIAKQKRMLQHNNELKADISVVTKENYVVTIKAAVRDFCRDRKWKISGMSQGKFVSIMDSMLQQKVQLVKRSKDDSVATWNRDTEFSLNNTRQDNTVATKKKSVTTTNPCY